MYWLKDSLALSLRILVPLSIEKPECFRESIFPANSVLTNFRSLKKTTTLIRQSSSRSSLAPIGTKTNLGEVLDPCRAMACARGCSEIAIDNKIILEIKSVASINKVMCAQTINYLQLSKLPVAYPINFNGLRAEWHRFINQRE